MTHSFVCIEHDVSGSACERLYVCVCVCKMERLCVHMCVCACVCARMFVRACMCLCVLCVFAPVCMCACVRVIEHMVHVWSTTWRFLSLETRVVDMCATTHSYVYHGSLIRVT